jgi:hypothetical protein
VSGGYVFLFVLCFDHVLLFEDLNVTAVKKDLNVIWFQRCNTKFKSIYCI